MKGMAKETVKATSLLEKKRPAVETNQDSKAEKKIEV
jgi:hypothetical protein